MTNDTSKNPPEPPNWSRLDQSELQKAVALANAPPPATDQSVVWYGYIPQLRASKLFNVTIAAFSFAKALTKAKEDATEAADAAKSAATLLESIQGMFFTKLPPLDLLIFLALEARRELGEAPIGMKELETKIREIYLVPGNPVLEFLPASLGVNSASLSAAAETLDSKGGLSRALESMSDAGIISHDSETNTYSMGLPESK